MFERFNKAAVQAVHHAVFTAHDRGDPAINTEHLLVGVAASPSPAAELLASMGASPQELRAAMSNLDAAALAAIGIDEDVLRLEPGVSEWSRKKTPPPFHEGRQANARRGVARNGWDQTPAHRSGAHPPRPHIHRKPRPGQDDPDRARYRRKLPTSTGVGELAVGQLLCSAGIVPSRPA